MDHYRFLAILILFISAHTLYADSRFQSRYSTRLEPSDYMLGSHGDRKDDIFERSRVIDLGVDLHIGSDCGRMDFGGTLRSTLKNLLDSRYFKDIGRNIIGASPLLLSCYMSPTWCAILKHTQISANLLSQMRLDQCSIIDKYTDSRVEDFYRDRQSCVRRQIDQNGGDIENALQHCQNTFDVDITNWAGGAKTSTNRLLGSSAQWAKMEGPAAEESLNLLKSMVGDTVVSRGQVSVEYGPRRMALTPRTYLGSLENETYDKLCKTLMRKIDLTEGRGSLDKIISNNELKNLDETSESLSLDRQTLEALSALPITKREIACRKLSDALALTGFTRDMNRSLDLMTTLSQNPNLPPHRKEEIEQKRKAFKEQIEMSLDLRREKNEPLNRVLAQINEDGRRARSELIENTFLGDAENQTGRQGRSALFDCADNILCE